MPLASGTRLGPYEILSPLGAGGMGEVYRARDSKLGREVAIKVLPDAFTKDPERLARFEREARLLASLNHPNIGSIYGLEESNGIRFLVLELVPGETLAELISQPSRDRQRQGADSQKAEGGRQKAEQSRDGQGAVGSPWEIDEVLKICRQIAEALEAAHEKGVIHRDLKPANIKVTPEGKVKVLDFGLAKAFAPDESFPNLSLSPTLTAMSLQSGVILGTAAYMSPEQARGKPLDKRSDIWSFGCVLYECLTARQPFGGETISDHIAAILGRDPDWQALPETTPGKVRDLLHRCLQKDRNQRLRDIGDARIEIDEALNKTWIPSPLAAPAGKLRSTQWTWMLLWCVLSLLTGAVATGIAFWSFTRPEPRAVARLAITIPAGERLVLSLHPSVVLSPDGSTLVYVAERGGTQLYLRGMDQLEAKPIRGTDGAVSPFFSPDGQWVGFFAGNKLKKVSLTGGAPLTICDASSELSRGAAWLSDDTILFTPDATRGLSRVSANGGAPQVITTPDTTNGEFTHRWPEILPGGKAVLFTMRRGNIGNYDDARIGVLSLETGKWQAIVEGGSNAHYVPTGHLVFGRAGSLLAAPFDLKQLKVTGPPFPILEGVTTSSVTGAAQFTFSHSGSLVYVPGGDASLERTLVLVNRRGEARPLGDIRGAFALPRLSPDGQRLAICVEGASNQDVWIYEIGRGTLRRLTFDPSPDAWPIWTPDGKRVTFGSSRTGSIDLFWKPWDGSGVDEKLLVGGGSKMPTSWSSDGQTLLFTETAPQTMGDIWVLSLKGDRKPQPFLRTPFDERGAMFSPDGRWIAYSSNETGRDEVFVQPYPGPGEKWQISTQGGDQPIWAHSGRELFYRNGDKMVAVAISTQPVFQAATPQVLFEGQYVWTAAYGNFANFDLAPDGQHFVMIKGRQQAAVTHMNVVLNWFEDLKRRAPTGKK